MVRRVVGTVVRVAVVAALVGAVWWFVGSAWGVADDLRASVLTYSYEPPAAADQVVDVGEDTITLARSARTQLDGVLALQAPAGRGVVGEVVALGADTVVRRFNLITGAVAAGEAAVLGPDLRPGDPFSAMGIGFQDVEVPGPLGGYPAWLVPGDDPTWIIYVHGWGDADRSGVNNLLPLFVELGHPVLAITYRGDPTAPVPDDPVFRWGLGTWEDVAAAAQYARDQGAERFVVFAHDQGASLVAAFLQESPLRGRALGAIYDSPVLAVDDLADDYLEREELPRYLAGPGKALASFRFHVRWSRLDQVGRAAELELPVLVLHGTADEVVPVETSDRFAAARPDLVTYERFEGAGHLLSWNADRSRYELAVRRFLADVQRAEPDETG